MYKQALDSVANRGTLGFGIIRNVRSHFDIGRRIHINMAVSCACFDYGNGRSINDSLNKPCAAAWYKNVDVAVQLH